MLSNINYPHIIGISLHPDEAPAEDKGEMRASGPTTRRWTPDEERKLDKLLDAGKEAAEIAVALNRTRQAIYARLQRLYRKRARLSVLARSGSKK
jgi:DNA-binding NarL/FixJ family response regulator